MYLDVKPVHQGIKLILYLLRNALIAVHGDQEILPFCQELD